MRVAINVRNIATLNKSGVDIYVEQLARFVPERDTANSYYLFVDKRATKEQIKSLTKPNVRVVKIPVLNDRHYLRVLKHYCKAIHVDMIHFPVGSVPEKLSIPYVVSVLDLTFEIHPEFYAKDDLLKQKATKLITQSASGVLSISESTKRDLIKFYKINPDRIEVTHLALKKFSKKPTKNPRKHPRPFLLFVGNIQPRKNLVNGVKALEHIPSKARPNLYIVGSGQDQQELKKLQTAIEGANLQDYVKIFGYLSNDELIDMYRACEAFFYPSIYEGFGYNVLEAFFFNKPIILSDNSSLPEIAGKAGVYVDPSSPISIATGIKTVLSNKDEVKRKVAIGEKRLRLFTPQLMAEKTVKAYKKFLSTKK